MRTASQYLRAFKTRLYMRFRPPARWRPLRDLLLLVALFICLTCYLSYMGSTTFQSASSSPASDGSRSSDVAGTLKRSILSQLTSQERRAGNGPGTPGPQAPLPFQVRLEQLLEQIENHSLQAIRQQRKFAIVRGMRNVVARDLPLYQRSLEKQSVQVHSPPWYRKHHLTDKNSTIYFIMDKPENYQQSPEEEEPGDWQLLLCMAFSDGDPGSCFEWKDITSLKPYTRVNRLPGIRSVLWQRDSLCTTTNLAKKLASLQSREPAPTCFVLPVQYQEFVNVAEALGYTSQWLLKPLTSIPGPSVVDVFSPVGQAELDQYNRQRAVAQQLMTSPLMVFGQPISIRLYVLVTSLLPLRAHVHSQGIVYHRYNHGKNFKKIAGRTWPLSQLWKYVSKNYGIDAVSEAINNIYQTLVHLLLLTELSIMTSSNRDFIPESGTSRKFRCRHCFQLLGVDIILNSTMHAAVIEVNGQPSVQESGRDEDFYINAVKEAVVQDTVNLVLSTEPVAKIVTEALLATQQNIGILGLNCRVSHNMCLSNDDLLWLLGSRREALSSKGFRQLYPSVHGEKFNPVLDDIQKLLTDFKASEKNDARFYMSYKTANLHPLATKLESFYASGTPVENFAEQDMKSAGCCRKTEDGVAWIDSISLDNQELLFPKCSDDPSTMPYLSGIHIQPTLKLIPAFSPLVTEYFANVTYDQLMVTITARAQNCQTEVRIDDKYGPTRTTNYTLGVGENRIAFMVVDITHTEPWVINNYSLLIHRPPITDGEPPFDPSKSHQVCSLLQECEMRVSPTELCGVQRDVPSSSDWVSYLSQVSTHPVCRHGDSPGRWVLPCDTCSERSTCYWRQAVWHPFNCKHASLSTAQLKTCLAGKRLLFIGDSTNRGMMHYVVERLNGTLNEWDKTHDIRVYTNVNSGRTALSFAYYPQFWLPTNQRPVFDKALYHLIQKSRPLQNNSNTILVVGGVQWLATQHLLMMLRALKVERLQGIKLVMKTLGAGFHQPVDGVHTLTMEEQRKLLLHSMGLADFAKHYNFEVIDTFNITVPRYKDFLQGKCACHFHKVVKISSPEDKFPRWRSRANSKNGTRQVRYHVEGNINAIYSEILLSRICSDFSDDR